MLDETLTEYRCMKCSAVIKAVEQISHCETCGHKGCERDFPTVATAAIAAQNDEFRRSYLRGYHPILKGEFVVTPGISGLGHIFCLMAAKAIAEVTEFTPENDPYGTRDFGALDVDGTRIFWKIDLYDVDLKAGSEHPADPEHTRRVLTVLLPSEY